MLICSYFKQKNEGKRVYTFHFYYFINNSKGVRYKSVPLIHIHTYYYFYKYIFAKQAVLFSDKSALSLLHRKIKLGNQKWCYMRKIVVLNVCYNELSICLILLTLYQLNQNLKHIYIPLQYIYGMITKRHKTGFEKPIVYPCMIK